MKNNDDQDNKHSTIIEEYSKPSKFKKYASLSLLSLIVISFLFFGIIEFLFDGSLGNKKIAKIGSSIITQRDFEANLKLKQSYIFSQFGGAISAEYLNSQEFKNFILQDLINQFLISQELQKKYNIKITKSLIKKVIEQDSTFEVGGKFSPAILHQYLENRNISVQEYYKETKATLEYRLLMGSMAKLNFLPTNTQKLINALKKQTRDIDILSISSVSLPQVSDDEVIKFYEKNKARFVIPESRIVKIFDIKQYIKNTADISVKPQDIAAFYNTKYLGQNDIVTKDFYHIIFSTKEEAQKALNLIKSQGHSFESVVQKLTQKKIDDIKFTNVKRGDFTQPISDTIFSLRNDQVSDIIETDVGYHIVKILKTNTKNVPSLPSITNNIKSELYQEKFCNAVADFADQLSNSFVSGMQIDEVLQKFATQNNTKYIQIQEFAKNDSLNSFGKKIFDILETDINYPVILDKARLEDNKNTEAAGCDLIAFQIKSIQPQTYYPLKEILNNVTTLTQKYKLSIGLNKAADETYQTLSKLKDSVLQAKLQELNNQNKIIDGIKIKYNLNSNLSMTRDSQVYSSSLISGVFTTPVGNITKPAVINDSTFSLAFIKKLKTPTPIEENITQERIQKLKSDSNELLMQDYLEYLSQKYKITITQPLKL